MDFSQFLKEDNGNLSSTRLIMYVWMFGVLFIWGFTSLKQNTLVDLPTTVVTVLFAVMGGKVIQKGFEKKE